MPYFALVILLLTSVIYSNCQDGSQYLRSVIRDLKAMKDRSTARRIDRTQDEFIPTNVPETYINARVDKHDVPELSLTRGELASLYEEAVSKGHTVQLETGADSSYVNAAIHEITDVKATNDEESQHADETGYYYYYYPIKSFLDEITSQPSDKDHHYSHKHKTHYDIKPKQKPNYNYHTHTHQHNVKISTTKASEGDQKNKLEPLFMAISGFLGMAVMFVLSVLVLPKFGIKPHKPKGKQELGDIARIALQAIEGQDCRERFACELSKTARSLNLQENRFIKFIWRIAPTSLSKRFASVNKYIKEMKCTAIPCKKKQSVVKTNPKNVKKKTKKI
ncbi:uncharacterized protein LOC123322089 [Coccinella septempunctata]|uniref:uncharacterized protein LOC123322089 n=1 Tax=Coccinella septempunctata TaxID=41139 RepID=UPI001D074C69|nr:uncharacterized protein LOC123322089 [Coccinella septempunctata]XP_044765870.1 uncharacterized protein LOC123322089 [Coccinella septempunctata]